MLQWYDDTPEARNESLKTVRAVHAKVAVKNPMTQYDMVLTQWAFVGPVLIFPTVIISHFFFFFSNLTKFSH